MQDYVAQLGQDRFVALALDGKRNGTFLDIGAGEPRDISNTWWLETELGWAGVLCDLETCDRLTRERKSPVLRDAFRQDWRHIATSLADEDGFIDFLSMDLEPPDLTMALVQSFPWDAVRFRVLTVEHDAYRAGGDSRRERMAEILEAHGYLRVGTASLNGAEIDDWWVDPSQVDEKALARVREVFA